MTRLRLSACTLVDISEELGAEAGVAVVGSWVPSTLVWLPGPSDVRMTGPDDLLIGWPSEPVEADEDCGVFFIVGEVGGNGGVETLGSVLEGDADD